MKKESLLMYRCPLTGSKLELLDDVEGNTEIIEGILYSKDSNKKYFIKDGIPIFSLNFKERKNKYAIKLFREKALIYDKYQHLSFETFYEKEEEVRNSMIDKLNIKNNSKILEVSAGTGRDSILISKHLSNKGLLHVQDISIDMLNICKGKLENVKIPLEIHQGDAVKLPYADNTFDGVYSFGGVGMNTYSNNKEMITELVRVAKAGSKVVFGGLSMAPWLKDTFFAKVLINNNNHYKNEISISDFPIEARDLSIKWILKGAGFVVDFVVGEGEPKANFEFDIPGIRGGTLLTRYMGGLEGVKLETKKKAELARKILGIPMHQWLNELIEKEADKVLNNSKE